MQKDNLKANFKMTNVLALFKHYEKIVDTLQFHGQSKCKFQDDQCISVI